jgi:membrane-associated phospholipid phosphatase
MNSSSFSKRFSKRFLTPTLAAAALLASSSQVRAQTPAPDAPAAPAPSSVPSAPVGPPPKSETGEPVKKSAEVQPISNPERKAEITPKPALPPPTQIRFTADPVSDGAVLSFALGVGALSEAIIGTGEIQPQQPNLDASLLSIDENSKNLSPSSAWRSVSNVGLLSAIGFAVVDPVLSGFRDGAQAGIVDAIIYGETLGITWSVTNLTKISFRRPRPRAYRDAEERNAAHLPADITTTDNALSFFSGHSSVTAAVSATATYLAFSRSPGTPRPWITLGVGILATSLTAYGRVRSGDHFPTDVIAGAMAGAGIGILVPHLQRSDEVKRRPVWIGAAPVPVGDGFTLTASGLM